MGKGNEYLTLSSELMRLFRHRKEILFAALKSQFKLAKLSYQLCCLYQTLIYFRFIDLGNL